jgi:(p)ppGpp synthase/HD superfamily hydrolase
MIYPTIQETIVYMMGFHADQKDKSGVSYFYHPVRVMIRLGPDSSYTEKVAALFHDVIEDTEASFDDIRILGYPEEVIQLLDLLTKRHGETHRQYIYRIVGSGNKSTMKIKLADMYDNANATRASACADPEVRENLLSMIETRYKPAIRFVRDALGKEADGIISDDVEVQFDFGGNEDD